MYSQEDNYTPITVCDQQEFEEITSIYPFHDDELAQVLFHIQLHFFEDLVNLLVRHSKISPLCQAPFPKSFPFSHFVPKVYCQVKEYIYACLKFSEDLHLRYTVLPTVIYIT